MQKIVFSFFFCFSVNLLFRFSARLGYSIFLCRFLLSHTRLLVVSHHLTAIPILLLITFCSYPKVAILEHFTVSRAQTLIVVQSLIEPLNRHFWVGAVTCWPYICINIIQFVCRFILIVSEKTFTK